MSRDEDKDAAAKAPPKPQAEAREARLAQALRANLRRRKASGRAPDEPAPKG